MFWGKSESASDQEYVLKVLTAAGYTEGSGFRNVDVNSETPLEFETEWAKVQLIVRIRDFEADDSGESGNSDNLDKAKVSEDSENSNCYFDVHKTSKFSIEIRLLFLKDTPGDLLLFGNDFDTPIRDFLPYGLTSMGLKVLKWVDPSVEGDLYADRPYLYGKALGSFNRICVAESPAEVAGNWDENLSNASTDSLDIPADPVKRQYFFAAKENLEKFQFQKGKVYAFDFTNDYISLGHGKFNLALPGGFELNLASYLQSFVTAQGDNDAAANWTLKLKDPDGKEGAESGVPLLMIKFRLEPKAGDELD
ncbi:unnamed protein product [Kuraishia capsulata CBS 1993]|uniref:Domain of unknown function at the cortex 1 domain-containing protein n=1 Tax=Kuraishia capsulata CBS 1993 TaxID=1382522 RepID=W6MNE3_9ASCO|nr:uncharacterized protein KUCA_T00004122001 [Kuraishia capsulata CBS 1993]CDK28141.1 unnamed protein product [Kuraishia capsulata CBS 1993]